MLLRNICHRSFHAALIVMAIVGLQRCHGQDVATQTLSKSQKNELVTKNFKPLLAKGDIVSYDSDNPSQGIKVLLRGDANPTLQRLSDNSKLSQIGILFISNDLTAESCAAIGKMPNLVQLGIFESTKHWPQELASSITKNQKIRILQLSGSGVSSNDLTHLAKLPNLEILEMDGCNLRGKEVELFHDCKKLAELSLNNNPLTTEDLESLRLFPQLERVFLRGTKCDKDVLETLVLLKNLELVDLTTTLVNANDYKYLKKSSSLTILFDEEKDQ